MAIGLVGRKSGMTRVFTEDGASIPVTVVEVSPNRVTQIKELETDGYRAIQVTTGNRKASKVSKSEAGHFAKAGVEAGSALLEFAGVDLPVATGQDGDSLVPLLHGEVSDTGREFAISEYDFAMTPMADKLGLSPREAVGFMVATRRWKLMHFEGGFRPILFDLQDDPDELNDLGDSPDHAVIIAEMYDHLFRWSRRVSQRTTISARQLEAKRRARDATGVIVGAYDETDTPLEFTVKYRGRTAKDHRSKD